MISDFLVLCIKIKKLFLMIKNYFLTKFFFNKIFLLKIKNKNKLKIFED